jgi:SrtB family sortase
MKSKHKNNNLLKYLIIAVVTFLLVFTGLYIYDNYLKKDSQIPSVDKLIKEKKKNNYKEEIEEDSTPYVNELPSLRLQYNNEYIMGRLEIPGVNINTLITRASNNEYYLNYNLYNQYDGLGVPFFDYRNTDLSNNRQINIYGHNTQNTKYLDSLPFTNLEAYVNKDIFDNNKTMFLSIDEKKIEYEIVAIKIITSEDNEHMKVIFSSDEDYLSHINKLLNNTLYKNDDLEITTKDKIIVLQVCHYEPANSYLLVIGKAK